MSSGNVPMMSVCEEERAPWNEKERYALGFDVEVSCTLERNVTITTDDYEEHGFCEDVTYDTSETNWEKAYEDNGHLPISALLDELKAYVESDLENHPTNSSRGAYLKRVLASCEGWKIVETDFYHA